MEQKAVCFTTLSALDVNRKERWVFQSCPVWQGGRYPANLGPKSKPSLRQQSTPGIAEDWVVPHSSQEEFAQLYKYTHMRKHTSLCTCNGSWPASNSTLAVASTAWIPRCRRSLCICFSWGWNSGVELCIEWARRKTKGRASAPVSETCGDLKVALQLRPSGLREPVEWGFERGQQTLPKFVPRSHPMALNPW